MKDNGQQTERFNGCSDNSLIDPRQAEILAQSGVLGEVNRGRDSGHPGVVAAAWRCAVEQLEQSLAKLLMGSHPEQHVTRPDQARPRRFLKRPRRGR